MFTKLQTNSIRHKTNFRGTDYDLDQQVVQFNQGRKARYQSIALKEKLEKQGFQIVEADLGGSEESMSEKRVKSNAFQREQNETQLKTLLHRYEASTQARYDHDCMDMCIPYAEVINNAEYRDLISDKDKVY